MKLISFIFVLCITLCTALNKNNIDDNNNANNNKNNANSVNNKPNFVLYVPDSLRAESLGCYGNPYSKTPNFDAFAKQGTLFEQCHTTYPQCTPSRASFLTGWYPHVNGHRTMWHMLRNRQETAPNTDYEPNLFRYLKNAGYDVYWWGKNDALSADSFPSSANEWSEGPAHGAPPNPFPFGDPLYYSFLYNVTTYPMEENVDYKNVQKAIDFLNTKPTRPFVIYLPLTHPHPPYTTFNPFYNMVDPNNIELRPVDLPNKPDFHTWIRRYQHFDKANNATLTQAYKKIQAVYLGSVAYQDFLFGRLMDTLRETGYENNTSVFLFSDHGDYGGDYGLVEKWPSGMEDVLTRVPMIVRHPKGGAPGTVARGPIQHMDMMATVLQIANINTTHTHFAQSFLPVLLGYKENATNLNRAVYCEGGYASTEPQCFEGRPDNPYDPIIHNPKNLYYPRGLLEQTMPLTACRTVMIRTLDWKLILRSDILDPDHYSELYDLQNDPKELVNQYNNPKFAPIKDQLQIQLLRWYIQTSDQTPIAEDPRNLPPPSKLIM